MVVGIIAVLPRGMDALDDGGVTVGSLSKA